MDRTELVAALETALGAHSTWKAQLQRTVLGIADGLSAETARRDDCCALGHLLLDDLPASVRDCAHYLRVVDLHRGFHAAAAEVLDLARAGQTQAAEALIDGRFATLSDELGAQLMLWRARLMAQP